MKKLIIPIIAALLIGCVSQSRTVYNTLASIQVTTSGAFNTYLDLVVTGKLATNSVPAISKDYNTFQTLWSSAVMVAQFNTNSVAPTEVISASTTVITDIANAKKGTP
jgi:acetylglutamate synthase